MISFITLTWNSEKYIKACIQSIMERCKAENILFEIIVVDNGSKDSTKLLLKDAMEKNPNVIKTIYLKKNMGTTYSRNLAIKKSTGTHICIIDSDTVVLKGSFLKVIDYLNKAQSCGIIAPKLLLPDDSVQHSVKKFPSFLQKISKLKKVFGNNPKLDTDYYSNFPFTNITLIDSAISACWIFKRSLTEEIGLLDEKIFYSPEDLDYCIRVRKRNKTIIYYPELIILHNTQQISHKNPFGRIAFGHFLGLLYYYRKHGGWLSTKKINNGTN